MGKKYLDTKQNTVEASILDVWVKSSEEQEAIHDAARMFVEAEKDHRKNPHPAGSRAWQKWNDAKNAAERKAAGKKPDRPAGLGAEPPKVDTALSDLPAPPARAGTCITSRGIAPFL